MLVTLTDTITERTGVDSHHVNEIIEQALEELHRLCIVGDKGPTDAVMEACLSFGGKASFHFIGILAVDRAFTGDVDGAREWDEMAKRFIPEAYCDGVSRVSAWLKERTSTRIALDG